MKIIKTSVTQQIIEYIKDNIQNGSWKVGEKIPSEPSLVEELGVSRASLRVAIQQYVALGVLRSEQGKGTYLESSDLDAVLGNKNSVSFSDFSNIEKVLEFRRIIEPEATYMAAKRPKEELDKLISILRKHYKVMEKSVGQASDFIAADMNFHREIAFASGNEIIGNTIAFVFANTFKWHQQINDYFGFTDGIWFHSEILKALESGNAKKAKSLMERHMTHAIDELNAQKG